MDPEFTEALALLVAGGVLALVVVRLGRKARTAYRTAKKRVSKVFATHQVATTGRRRKGGRR